MSKAGLSCCVTVLDKAYMRSSESCLPVRNGEAISKNETAGCGYEYCLFCRTGKEGALAKRISDHFPCVPISPWRVKEERKHGVWTSVRKPLLPGYLFLYAKEELPVYRIQELPDVLRFLSYGGEFRLGGEDLKFAKWVLKYGGLIGLSQAFREGDHIVVTGGPMKDYEGSITKVDKRKRIAKVHVAIGSSIKPIWMSFEWIAGPGENRPI